MTTSDHATAVAMASNAVLLNLLKFLTDRSVLTREESKAILVDAQIDLRSQGTEITLAAAEVVGNILEKL